MIYALKIIRNTSFILYFQDNNKEEFQAFSGKGTSLRDGIAE